MSHTLPPLGHPARDMFEVSDLVAIATGEVPVLSEIWRLRRSAETTFASSSAARRVAFIRLNGSTDELELVTVGRRGGWRREWRFGPATRATRLA